MPLAHQPAVLSLLLTLLRRGRGLEQEDLAEMSGRSVTQITRWENGDEPLWKTLVELAVECMKYDLDEVEALRDDLSRVYGLHTRDGLRPRVPASPISLTEIELREIRRASGRVGRAALDAHADLLIGEIRTEKVRQAREAAEVWCGKLLAAPAARRRLDLEPGSPLAWAIAERLAELSARAAARSFREALEIARLACRVARLVSGDRLWQARLRGFCLAFLANAWRVAGKLKKAERIFRRAEALWNHGEAGDPDRILAAWRLFDLEASLQRDGRHFAAALSLLDRAKEAAPRSAWGRILLKRVSILDAMIEPEQALLVLQEAAPLIAEGNDPRLRYGAFYSECGNLCRLGRYRDAERALHSALQVAAALGNELDLVRLLGLRGRVDAGMGRAAAALESFQAARRHFDREKMAYDFALASLEEAELRLTLNQHERVKRLVARDMLWVFEAEEIHREALAALTLFREAVEGGRATAELARRILQYLERAENDTGLRFEE